MGFAVIRSKVNSALFDIWLALRQKRSSLFVPFLTMFAWFWVVARWFPLREGRDMMTYFLCFRDLLQIEPEFPLLMLFRMPLTPLFYGTCFEFLEQTGIEWVLALLYAGSMTSVFAVIREFSTLGAWTLHTLLGANLWLFRWFNAVGSETLQTVFLCLWFSFTFFAMRSAKLRVWAGVAMIVFLLVLNRPSNQTFALCFLLPLFIASVSVKRRLMLSGSFLMTYAAAHLAFCSVNYLRYGEFCVAELGNAHLPFYRLFVQEHVISPSNGPASLQLANFVAEKVLTNPIYQEYEITQDVFFRCSTQRMFNSLIYAFQENGSADDFAILRKAGMESIRQDLKGSLLRYLEHLITVFDYGDRKPIRISNLRDFSRAFVRERAAHYSRYAEKGLPLPTEGDLLPSMPLFAAKEGRRNENWFGLQRAVSEWKLAPAASSSPVAEMLYGISRKLIPNYYWFLFSALCLVFASLTGPIDLRVPLLTAIALASLLVTLFGSVQWEFRYPFDPIFTAFTVHASHCLIVSLRKSRMALLSERVSALLRRLQTGFQRFKLAR
jgi:hypothetical protein